MKTRLYLVAFIFIFCGCDEAYEYAYEVSNSTNEEIVIRTKPLMTLDFLIKDSIFTILPNQTQKIIVEDGGILSGWGNDYYPESRYTENAIIPPENIQFDVYISDTLVTKNLRIYKLWEYTSQKMYGIYTLKITEDLLKNYKSFFSFPNFIPLQKFLYLRKL